MLPEHGLPHTTLMPSFTTADIVGTWRVVRTEIPSPYKAEEEFFHFSPEGIHAWEYPFLQSQRIFRFRYSVTDSGVCLTDRNGNHPRDLPMLFDGDHLVITGPHGYSSWLQRIPAAERPSFLTEFYPPLQSVGPEGPSPADPEASPNA